MLAPHLCAAAAELPLTEADLALFGPEAPELIPQLEKRGLLRGIFVMASITACGF